MALSTKLHSSFWSDEDIGRLDPAGKLAIVWVLTNKDMNNLGVLKVQNRQFEFDTSVPLKALEGALKGLTRSFRFEDRQGGLKVLAVNYVEHQFGDHSLTHTNHITKHLCNLLKRECEEWQELLFERYKTLARSFEILCSARRGFEGAYKALPRDQNSIAQHSTEQNSEGDSQGGSSPDGQVREKLVKIGAENVAEKPGAVPRGTMVHTEVGAGRLRYDLAEEILKFLNGLTGASFLGTPVHLREIALRLESVDQDVDGVKRMIERQHGLWSVEPKMVQYLRPATLFEEGKFAGYWGQKDLPLVLGNRRERIEDLKAKIEKSPANRQSLYWKEAHTGQDRADLKRWRQELAGLEGQ